MLKPRIYSLIACIFFGAVAMLHLVRLVAGLDFVIGGRDVPAWLSVIAVAVLGWLAVEGFRISRQRWM
jgi:hypothetical protein